MAPAMMSPEHPWTALLAVAAMFLAMLLILLARIAVQGIEDLHATFLGEPQSLAELSLPPPGETPESQREAALAASRWATVFAP